MWIGRLDPRDRADEVRAKISVAVSIRVVWPVNRSVVEDRFQPVERRPRNIRSGVDNEAGEYLASRLLGDTSCVG